MSAFLVSSIALLRLQQVQPTFWMNLKGEFLVEGRAVKPRINPGVFVTRIPEGKAFNFTANKSGILLGDLPQLRLDQSITISTWINPRSYVNDGPGAQILFRGDDRSGHDPYSLAVLGDGTITFGIQNDDDQGMAIRAELPLNRWTHVTGSFDGVTGELNLWLNGEKVAYAKTSKRPFATLNNGFTPGVGIGNVQNDSGPHNQPFNGILADLRVYATALTPDQAGYTGRSNRIDP